MNENPTNTAENFENLIFDKLGERMTVAEAISLLGEFHAVSDEVITDAFSRLKEPEAVYVEFEMSVSRSEPCYKFTTFKEDGTSIYFSLIDKCNGQPIPHVS